MAILLQLVHTKCWLHCVVTYVRVDIHWVPLPPGFLFLMELHWYGTNASKYPICTVLVASFDNNQLLLQTCSYATSRSFFVSGDVSLPLEHYRIMSISVCSGRCFIFLCFSYLTYSGVTYTYSGNISVPLQCLSAFIYHIQWLTSLVYSCNWLIWYFCLLLISVPACLSLPLHTRFVGPCKP